MMATKKNDIALSFDKAEYYTLEEASEYLNRKHGLDNVTPKKLLKHIVSYNIATFIFAQGFSLQPVYEFQDIDISESDKDEFMELANSMLSCIGNVNEGVLLQIDSTWLAPLIFSKTESISSVTSGDLIFTDIFDIFSLERMLDLFLKPSDIENNLFSKFSGKKVSMSGVEPYFLVPKDNYDKYLDWNISNCKLEILDATLYENEDRGEYSYVGLEVEIKLSDLILLHKDIGSLEAKIVENAPIPQKEPPQINDIQSLPRVKGKSPKKVLVQEMARFYALAEWKNDTDKEIKQAAMADTVWRKLADAGFSGELQSIEQVKAWIKPVAPPHAKEAGRPSNSRYLST